MSMKKKSAKIKAGADGNCLFRCFSQFLDNNQNSHMRIRLIVIDNIIRKWDAHENFVLRSNYYKRISSSDGYYDFMSRDGEFGTQVEIKSFVELSSVYIEIYWDNSNFVSFHGNNSDVCRLHLLYSEEKQHFVLLDYTNTGLIPEILNIFGSNQVKRKNDEPCAVDDMLN